jgi:hypothetical protein
MRCILYNQVQLGTTFAGTPQCAYGVKQAWVPIYSRGGLKHQDHMAMNAKMLNNPLTWFYCNEQKAIARARRHVNLKWDRP